MKQTTHTLLMIEPTNFGFNEEAFETNSFQERPENSEVQTIQSKALDEFNAFVHELRELGVNVMVFKDRPNSTTPDSIFPNNWISTHQTGELITYPMAVPNRRNERREDVVDSLVNAHKYTVKDLSFHEQDTHPIYLEGTGSMLFDHANKVVYGAISPRTDEKALNELGKMIGYDVVSFTSYGKSGELIYHTNVMLCIGRTYAVIGTDTIAPEDQEHVLNSLKAGNKTLIELSNDQVYNHFAGNMLQVENQKGESILVMSQNAYDSLNKGQLDQLNEHNDHLLSVSIPTIERIGGGSARCMLAEIFLPNFNDLNS